MGYPYNYAQKQALLKAKHKLEAKKDELVLKEAYIKKWPGDNGVYEEFYKFVKKELEVE